MPHFNPDKSLNKRTKILHKLEECKRACRSELILSNWSRRSYASLNWWPNASLPTLTPTNYTSVPVTEFRARFEAKNQPTIIQNAMHDWPASKEWTLPKLTKRFKHEKFKVGEDDKKCSVFLPIKLFSAYVASEQVKRDDSPLYIFDSSFATRITPNSAKKPKHAAKKTRSSPTASLLNDYTVPKYFTDDLFQYVGQKHRPPYRWIVIGPARSGSGIHVDPLGTSAWNALISGHKRWVLFPPGTDQAVIDPKGTGDNEAITWFAKVYPKCVEVNATSGLGMIEVVQKAGEIMYVPGGWWHVVMNLDTTIAVTQNFFGRASVAYTWLKTRHGRPKLARRVYAAFLKRSLASKDDAYMFREIVKEIDALQTVPELDTSSSDGSSSSSSSSDSESDEDELVNRKTR